MKTLLLGIVSALLLLAPAQLPSPASATKGGPRGPVVPYDLFAVVNANGTLARGTPGTTVGHPGAGVYHVTFGASVAGCAAIGNLGYAGTTETFTFPAVALATAGNAKTVIVNVIFPGNIPGPGGFPNRPVLRDNSFHLHVDCNHALFANVAANGTLSSASPGVTANAHVAGSGRYVLNFGRDISACAPTATVHAAVGGGKGGGVKTPGIAIPSQAYLALGADGKSLTVSVNATTTAATDRAFSVVVTCGEEPSAVFAVSNGFYNAANIPEAIRCALTANWYNPAPGGVPSNQGYVATWSTSTNTAGVQTKNGGYGIELGFGVDLVASC